METTNYFAIKIIKNAPAYNQQCKQEIYILRTLQDYIKQQMIEQPHIIQLLDQFVHEKHACLVFPLMQCSLLDTLRFNNLGGLRVQLVRNFIQQIVNGLDIAEQCGVVHADLKPENIMIDKLQKEVIKIIDFGSSCFWNNRSPYIYIQSRFYRAPEIIMRCRNYTNKIDIWSLGCIAVELLCGQPLFPCAEEYSCLQRILQITKEQPTQSSYISKAEAVQKFFIYNKQEDQWILKSQQQYEYESQKPIDGCYDKNHPITSLNDLKPYYEEQRDNDGIFIIIKKQKQDPDFRCFLDFVQKCLKFDPNDRITANNARYHKFVNGKIQDEDLDLDLILDQLDTQYESNQSSTSFNEDQFDY